MGTCSSGNDDVSAVFGRMCDGRSITTLKVPGSWLSVVAVWSSTVENECERACASGRPAESAWECCWKALPSLRSGSGGVGSEWGVREP